MKFHTLTECGKFRDVREVKVSNAQAEMMVMKLARHFKLPIRFVEFYNYRTALAMKWGARIRLWHNPNVRIISHEVCHFLCWKKFPDKKVRHGTKRWYRQMKIITNYAKKKNYWKEEFERRTAPKEPKPEPTKEELRQRKIERLEQGIKRHQTKIKRCQTLIKKNNRRISHLRRFI